MWALWIMLKNYSHVTLNTLCRKIMENCTVRSRFTLFIENSNFVFLLQENFSWVDYFRVLLIVHKVTHVKVASRDESNLTMNRAFSLSKFKGKSAAVCEEWQIHMPFKLIFLKPILTTVSICPFIHAINSYWQHVSATHYIQNNQKDVQTIVIRYSL